MRTGSVSNLTSQGIFGRAFFGGTFIGGGKRKVIPEVRKDSGLRKDVTKSGEILVFIKG